MIPHLLIIFSIKFLFLIAVVGLAFLSLSWVEKREFRLVYMYGKEIRKGNKKEKGNKRGK